MTDLKKITEGSEGIEMKYPEDFINQIITGDCLEVMKDIPDNSIDLVITSPPYDNLRDYKGYSFDFEGIAKELFRVIKKGGVVVWVVGDSVIDGSESLTSFTQAIYFKLIGFNIHDTMIYEKNCCPFPDSTRYYQVAEYMFILSKGKPKTFNPIMQKNTYISENHQCTSRDKNGELQKRVINHGQQSPLKNVWKLEVGYMKTTKDDYAYKHPAMFPEKLAEDHILSWSNTGDIVMDIFSGSGTTCKMARKNDRRYIGIDLSEEYNQIAKERLRILDMQPKLF